MTLLLRFISALHKTSTIFCETLELTFTFEYDQHSESKTNTLGSKDITGQIKYLSLWVVGSIVAELTIIFEMVNFQKLVYFFIIQKNNTNENEKKYVRTYRYYRYQVFNFMCSSCRTNIYI